MINQDAVDTLAQSVAQQVFRDAGVPCGYIGRIDLIGKRVLFAFKRLAAFSHQEVKLVDLERAHSWQGIFEAMVEQTLRDTAPFELARKLALKEVVQQTWGSPPPEIAPSVDPQGRRHFRMFCEPGIYNFKDKANGEDDEGTASGPQGGA